MASLRIHIYKNNKIVSLCMHVHYMCVCVYIDRYMWLYTCICNFRPVLNIQRRNVRCT